MTRPNLYIVISSALKEADKVVILRNRNRIELETSALRFANTKRGLLVRTSILPHLHNGVGPFAECMSLIELAWQCY
jgi:hypothetical protein